MKAERYTVVHPDGKVERIKVPIFSSYDVAARIPHSLVFLHIPKGSSLFVDHNAPHTGSVQGPATVYVKDERTYWVPQAPETDADAYKLWRDYVHIHHQGSAVHSSQEER